VLNLAVKELEFGVASRISGLANACFTTYSVCCLLTSKCVGSCLYVHCTALHSNLCTSIYHSGNHQPFSWSCNSILRYWTIRIL